MPASSLRHPRLRVLADGVLLPGAIAADIASNNHYAADRYRLSLHVTPSEAAAWADATSALLDIQLALQGEDWTSLIQGEVDQLQLDPRTGLLSLHGRDLTARLVDVRTQETFANQTSSDIAGLLAARHGLAADIAPTTTPVGAYWQLEHDHITLDSFTRSITEWDLLTALAGHEDFDVWVTGATLHFQPRTTAASPAAILRPWPDSTGPANIISLRLERSLTLARDIEVTVKSWNSRQANAFTQTARLSRQSGVGAGPGAGGKATIQRYVLVVPNLTPDAALKLAQTRLAELSRHERILSADMPGDLTLQPRQMIWLDGTGTGFDQPYWIDEITRRIDAYRGFSQHLRARNSNLAAQATSPASPIL